MQVVRLFLVHALSVTASAMIYCIYALRILRSRQQLQPPSASSLICKMLLNIDSTMADNASQLSNDSTTSTTSPLRFLLTKLPASMRVAGVLKEGDQAQAMTLRLLEKTQDFMDKPIHNSLHERYDDLRKERLHMKRGLAWRTKKWNKIVTYRDNTVELRHATVVSSELARSMEMWKRKAQTSAQGSGHSDQDWSLTGTSQEDAQSRRSALDEIASDLGNAQSMETEDSASGNPPTTSLADAPAAPEAEESSDPSTAPQAEEDVTGQTLYGAFQVDSQGQLIGDTGSVISEIELKAMVKSGQVKISDRLDDDNPFGDGNAVASACNVPCPSLLVQDSDL
ncbi:uncharacterized protein B0H18DRAFT_1025274 [Fomitopsis serialis]|uniref:uncharacterized protein n=1 Tax=Fomitopsis serialis TaxID=139415 RepID=UPI002007C5CB|nr:uncharacterized protein B0H18DRAFT_1025274 [Neoantrodia serialis]KAH9920135.1 hypothetical protein B0H18DRAFT_1025274 [Neoantrodia serialis]